MLDVRAIPSRTTTDADTSTTSGSLRQLNIVPRSARPQQPIVPRRFRLQNEQVIARAKNIRALPEYPSHDAFRVRQTASVVGSDAVRRPGASFRLLQLALVVESDLLHNAHEKFVHFQVEYRRHLDVFAAISDRHYLALCNGTQATGKGLSLRLIIIMFALVTIRL